MPVSVINERQIGLLKARCSTGFEHRYGCCLQHGIVLYRVGHPHVLTASFSTRLHLPRLHQYDNRPSLGQPRMLPLRQWPSFQLYDCKRPRPPASKTRRALGSQENCASFTARGGNQWVLPLSQGRGEKLVQLVCGTLAKGSCRAALCTALPPTGAICLKEALAMGGRVWAD